jgi:hypothetical protein
MAQICTEEIFLTDGTDKLCTCFQSGAKVTWLFRLKNDINKLMK